MRLSPGYLKHVDELRPGDIADFVAPRSRDSASRKHGIDSGRDSAGDRPISAEADITVAIASPRTLVRHLLAAAITSELQNRNSVVEFSSVEDLDRRHEELRGTAVLLIDATIGLAVFSAIARLRMRLPECKVLLLSNTVGDWITSEASFAGVTGFVHEFDFLTELFVAVRATLRGSVYHSPQCTSRASVFSVADLSPQEISVLKLACQGMTDEGIGRALHISPNTVENHRASLLRKLKLPDHAALLLFGCYCGLSQLGQIDLRSRVRRTARSHHRRM